MSRISIIEAPSNLGLKPPSPGKEPGVVRLPHALKQAGLYQRLQANLAGSIAPLPYSPQRDDKLHLLNPHAIHAFTVRLAESVGDVLEKGDFPLVLGGDCSILLGSLLALKKKGRYGLFFLDGHIDFYANPADSATGGAAGMELALVSGRGPDLLTNIEGQKPLVLDQDVVVFGYHEEDQQAHGLAHLLETSMRLSPLWKVRKQGIHAAGTQAIDHFRRQHLPGFWVHLDADVLDEKIMPAVDSPQPGGMSYEELSELLRIVLTSGLAVGMQVTIFDPDLDPDGRIAQNFTDALVRGFNK